VGREGNERGRYKSMGKKEIFQELHLIFVLSENKAAFMAENALSLVSHL
jgi:hypothetical protein